MRKPASSRSFWSAVALCTAGAVQAAPACTAMATHSTWADCASTLASYGAVSSRSGGADGTLTFDRAFGPVDSDGDGAAVASIDFTSRGASSSQAPAAVFATTAVPAIPEPHTNLLMLAGLAAIGFMAMGRRRP